MLRADLLAVEHVGTPDARELQTTCNILVHQLCDVMDRATPAHGKRFVLVCRAARCLRIDPDDLERAKQESAELIQAVAGLGRHRQRGKTQPEQFLENLDFLRVRVQVTLVGDQHCGQLEPERVVDLTLVYRRCLGQPRPFGCENNLPFPQPRQNHGKLLQAVRVADIDHQQRPVGGLQCVDQPGLHEVA